MEYGRIEGLDKPIARLVQGTLMIGADHLDESFALLDGVLAAGGNAFDTARVYGRGETEQVFGQWVQARGNRDQIVLIGKGAHPDRGRPRVTPQDINDDIAASLAALNTDHFDVYLLHRDDPSVPVGPIVEVLNEHHAAGRIGVFGGSNWSTQRIDAANAYAAAHHLVPFRVSSPNFSLAERVREPWGGCLSIAGDQGAAARDWYADTGMALFTWSSLAGGFFSGRFQRDNLDTFSEPLDKVCVEAYGYEENFQRLERADALAQEYGVTTAQIALAYILNQPLNLFALVGCRTIDEYRENAAALDLKLTPGELAWLDLKTPTA